MLRKLTLALITALLISTFHPTFTHAHSQNVSISVSRDGYDHMANYAVEVEAGHEVTITFNYADEDLDADNPHKLWILGAGVNLPAVEISRDNPTATITFTPTKTGTLTILCVNPCIGMEKLVGGTIKVVGPKPSGASASLALELTQRDDESVLARVMLKDARGSALSDVPIVLTMHTSLGGELELGTPVTVEDGSAVFVIPAVSGQKLVVSALFEGGNGLSFAQNSGEITMPGAPVAHPLGALSSPTAPPVLALILLVVLGGIWATYGMVVFQVFRIRGDEGPVGKTTKQAEN